MSTQPIYPRQHAENLRLLPHPKSEVRARAMPGGSFLAALLDTLGPCIERSFALCFVGHLLPCLLLCHGEWSASNAWCSAGLGSRYIVVFFLQEGSIILVHFLLFLLSRLERLH